MVAFALTIYAIACGYTAAGLMVSAWRVGHAQTLRFRARFDGISNAFWSLALCIFGGPYIILDAVFSSWRRGSASGELVAGTVFVSVLWSFCSGVVLVQTVLVAHGLLTA